MAFGSFGSKAKFKLITASAPSQKTMRLARWRSVRTWGFAAWCKCSPCRDSYSRARTTRAVTHPESERAHVASNVRPVRTLFFSIRSEDKYHLLLPHLLYLIPSTLYTLYNTTHYQDTTTLDTFSTRLNFGKHYCTSSSHHLIT